MKFTAHNVRLSNGQKTMGDSTPLLGESAVWKSIENTLHLLNLLPASMAERGRIRVADLGCLEGGYAVEFAKLGFDTWGFEAREENVANCNYLKEDLKLSNLNFVKDDVRNLANYGEFDIVLCYGLLYHLNDPVNFLNLLGKTTKKLLLLNTHFAPARDVRYDLGPINNYFIGPLQKRVKLLNFTRNYRLSRMTTNEGYNGRWYKEWDESAGQKKIEKLLWASYNNNRSFWLKKKDLTQVMQKAGFNSVFEQFDFTGDLMPDNYTEYYNRTMFVGIKHS
ncbi:MAG TPA: methyltransferase domain-containing protein [Arachidicoccus sp.]|nr:methyltransferase domain-containing protein [Arachidicoccus sp.]